MVVDRIQITNDNTHIVNIINIHSKNKPKLKRLKPIFILYNIVCHKLFESILKIPMNFQVVNHIVISLGTDTI